MRITADQRAVNENRIRAAIDRLLRGDIPPGGRCDVKTLAREAGVDRTAFYGNRPYAHLRAEFEQRLQALQQAGQRPDPRDAQITPAQERDHYAEGTPHPVGQHDQRTHRLPRPRPWPGSPPSTTRSPACGHPPPQPAASRDCHSARPPSVPAVDNSDQRLQETVIYVTSTAS